MPVRSGGLDSRGGRTSMSQDPEEGMPSRGPKPESRRPAGAKAGGSRDEPTTWRPNPRDAKAARERPEAAVDDKPDHVPGGPGWWERIFFGRVGSGQLALFCRQFAAYLAAGVDLLKALSSLEKQFARTALGPVIGRLLASVRRGDALAE